MRIKSLIFLDEDFINDVNYSSYQYKKFFENAPIKLPSGILLYGYPGTGKTLLGLAIPSLVHTKFIHIKVLKSPLRFHLLVIITLFNLTIGSRAIVEIHWSK